MRRTRAGHPVHLQAWDYHKVETGYQRFNKRVALAITGFVGSMTCAWIFCVLALASLPAVLTIAFGLTIFPHFIVAAGLIALVAWIAQTFLQLVLLSVIMVGSNVSQEAADIRAVKQFEDVELIVDRLDTTTKGGLEVLESDLRKIINHLGVEDENA